MEFSEESFEHISCGKISNITMTLYKGQGGKDVEGKENNKDL